MDDPFLASAGSTQRQRADENQFFHQNQWVGLPAMGNSFVFNQATMDGSFLASAGFAQRQGADEN